MKTCTKCKQEQPFTSFCKDKNKRDGVNAHCKGCKAEYRNNNKAALAAYNAEYRNNNKAAIGAYNAEYRNNNKAAIAAYNAEYHAEPANNLRGRASAAFRNGLKKATKFNDGVKPIISAEEQEMMVSFLMAARTLSETTGIAFEVDHIIPLSKGGLHRLSNMQCITKADNEAKHDSLNYTEYTQKPSFPRPEDIAACEELTACEVAA